MPDPVKYSARRGAASATWTLPGMRGMRIKKQGGYWRAGYSFYTHPYLGKMLLNAALEKQRFCTLQDAAQAVWVAHQSALFVLSDDDN